MKKQRKSEESELPADVSRLPGWRRARQVVDPTRVRLPARRITINLDQDIVAVFKAEALAGGPPYQVAINQALRDYLRNRSRSEREYGAELVLSALDDEKVIEKLRAISQPAGARERGAARWRPGRRRS